MDVCVLCLVHGLKLLDDTEIELKKPALTSTSTDAQWIATTITLDSELTLQGGIFATLIVLYLMVCSIQKKRVHISVGT